jgi:beta-galactosidase
MKHMRFVILFTAALVLSFSAAIGSLHAQSPAGARILRTTGNHFELDGKPFQIISGAIHYSRVSRPYWRDRLRKARAMGLNTVETYVFWDMHEPAPNDFDFSGQNDIAEFIREAQQEGLFVILRPGPYVCAEWDFGGLPAWLLREPGMQVRSKNPAFMAAATRWLHRLGQELAPLQSGYGGPIIAVQVENEYGSFGSDHEYMEGIHRLLVDSGFDRAMLFTADGADELQKGSLPELPVAINFGTGNAKVEFAKLTKLRPNGPRMCGEYWVGWYDHWGEKHHRTDAAMEADELKWILQQGYSVNLYMFDGGTSFGWMNGANSNGTNYEPDTTSYDYDAPVNEGGELTPKFFLFRDAIRQVTGVTPPDPPLQLLSRAFTPIKLGRAVSLWQNLPAPTDSIQTLSMEDAGQSYGYILYRTTIAHSLSAKLNIEELHGYAQIYVDGGLAGTLDRRLNQSSLDLRVAHGNAQLDILIENTGRVNFGQQLPYERSGITHRVTLGGIPLTGWKIYPLPFADVSKIVFNSEPCNGACFYQSNFDIDEPADTYIDTRRLGHGQVWINGHLLGRFWKIGPQGALYLPAPWLKKGRNEIVVFDLNGQANRSVPLVAHSILVRMGNLKLMLGLLLLLSVFAALVILRMRSTIRNP